MSTMAARIRSPLQQHDNFTMFAINSNLVPTTSTCSTSTSSYSVWNNGPKLSIGPSLGVCFRVPPWPPPFKAVGGIGGVADFMPEAKIQQELESRTTLQEGEDDVDIPAIDTTTPNGQQAYITRDQAYMLNSQCKRSCSFRFRPSVQQQ